MREDDGRKNRKAILKQCVNCNEEFMGKTTSKYCSDICRIFSRVKKCESGCWEWQAYCEPGGYGRTKVSNEKAQLVHRFVYMQTKNVQLDVKQLVCHKCDNRKCVNPDHLFVGSHKDNMDDCINKNRRTYPTGEESTRHKLTWKMVDEIRKLRQEGWTIMKLGEKFKVYHSNISRICLNKTWKRF